ncbi:uncharacterized protein LOC126894980 [Daktulosphaira vitifoliae]|uniref:uncharacterized protein LOC126894980 n=1 Tax=Daktulosphaira vitifoliae TaxID=58002 RepID=UPI0021AA67A8|nr:uncharacterized protein LOC126894980 [Daktulosphaira vitifoliae]
MQAYDACTYTRTTDIYGKEVINLLCAKSRVAPLKVVSLPRLELLAALLAACFMSKYAPKLQLPINEYFYWTDSTLVLNWLLSPSSRWKTFMGNKVSEIQELTSVSQWKHVASSDNPADIVSRGCFPSQMKSLDLWWNGPSWLKGEHTQWPSNFQELNSKTEYLSEEKVITNLFLTTENNSFNQIFKLFSSLSKLLRVVAYCLRVKSNLLSSDTNIYGPVKATEIENSLKRLVKVAQQEEFFTELCDLKNSKLVSSKSKLFRLKPFLDNDGIIRVGGRLKHAVSLSFFQKHQIVQSIGNALFNYEELYTILVRIEAILNSRPSTPLSTDPNDLSVLTPGHFLIGDSLSAFPERDVTNIMENRLTRWRRVVQITQKYRLDGRTSISISDKSEKNGHNQMVLI